MARSADLIVLAALALASTATAAPPISQVKWNVIVATYTAQAAAHGAKAICTEYDPTGAHKMQCRFGSLGRVVVNAGPARCIYKTIVFYPGGSRKAPLIYCGPAWDSKALPAPWTYKSR
jgi:hypothetical protein